MADLPNSPDDIITLIIDEVGSHDLENFAITCKRIFALAHRRLKKHLSLKKEYSKVALNFSDRSEGKLSHFAHPIFLLSAIWDTPSIAEYVTHLEYHDRLTNNAHHLPPDFLAKWQNQLHARVNGPNDIWNLVPSLLATNKIDRVYLPEAARWRQRAEDGLEEVTFPLLLFELHWLESLKVRGNTPSRGYSDLLGHYLRDAVSENPTKNSNDEVPFQKLKRVTLEWACSKWAVWAGFAALPAMEKFKYKDNAPTLPIENIGLKSAKTKISVLRFAHDPVYANNLETLLFATHDLLEFRYTFDMPRGDGKFYARGGDRITSAVESVAAKTLEKLSILMKFDDSLGGAPLRFTGFNNLRHLELDFQGLRTNEETVETRPGKFFFKTDLEKHLPASLETLTLHAHQAQSTNSCEELEQVFRNFGMNGPRILPNLKKVVICSYGLVTDYVREQFKMAGIELQERPIAGYVKAFRYSCGIESTSSRF